MKTKTNTFTKVINFCVLALFLITNMIFFTSCDNGNSPNENTKTVYCDEEPVQVTDKNSASHQHDFCDICEGNQTEKDHYQDCPSEEWKEEEFDFCDYCEGIQEESHMCESWEEDLG